MNERKMFDVMSAAPAGQNLVTSQLSNPMYNLKSLAAKQTYRGLDSVSQKCQPLIGGVSYMNLTGSISVPHSLCNVRERAPVCRPRPKDRPVPDRLITPEVAPHPAALHHCGADRRRHELIPQNGLEPPATNTWSGDEKKTGPTPPITPWMLTTLRVK